MNVRESGYALLSCAAGALIAGCGSSQSPDGGLDAMPQSRAIAAARAGAGRTRNAWSYRIVHAFKIRRGDKGEGHANGGLVAVGDTLYGTTFAGGGSPDCSKDEERGCGSVYSLTTNGKHRLLYAFSGFSGPPSEPWAGLTDVDGTLYGTTLSGGSDGYGTVYSISTSGDEQVLHSFSCDSDGASPPQTPLIDVKGTLYGATTGGGYKAYCSTGLGTIYRITTSGEEKVVYRFYDGDVGWIPTALIDVNGTLYGANELGGGSKSCSNGCGVIYSLTTSGHATSLYKFTGGTNGQYPQSLVNVNGTFYGTAQGGSSNRGIVYRVTTAGKMTVLYRFRGGSDGANPLGMIDVKGTLYGTTTEGGAGCSSRQGCGTIFSITTTGTENVLYSFTGGPYGTVPTSPLLNLNGTLYGTTSGPGSQPCGGCGVVFALSPSLR
jgi:uncharacterized repeat protein (TIGR03803 family)